MIRHVTLLLTIPMLVGCELDLFEPDWDGGCFFSCGGYGYDYTPPATVSVSGQIFVGEYEAMEGEARILLYAASDTVSPVDSIQAYGWYHRDFGPTPGAQVCGYLARAVLWSGESSGLEPLFPTQASCQATSYGTSGPTFHLPAYPTLAEPFVLRGRVLVDGEPAQAEEVRLGIWMRQPPMAATGPVMVTTSAGGDWSLEVSDGAQRYELCRWVNAEVQHVAATGPDHPRLNQPSRGICESERTLPDVRIGTRKAAVVEVLRDVSPGVLQGVVAGAARVSLRLPSDSSLVGEEVTTLDDGTAHVWFPHDMASPGCAFLLKVELGARVQYHPLQPVGATDCWDGRYLPVQFIGD